MTWTKLGDEFLPETATLSDAAYRLHVDMLVLSNWRLLDLLVSKLEAKRYTGAMDPEQAAKELVEAGWWQDCGDAWFIGCKFSEWQRDRSQVEHRREQLAQAQRRRRRHVIGDHSLCLNCVSSGESTVDTSDDYRDDPGRDGTVTGRGNPNYAKEEKETSSNSTFQHVTTLAETRASLGESGRASSVRHRCDRCESTSTQIVGMYRLCREHAGAQWKETA